MSEPSLWLSDSKTNLNQYITGGFHPRDTLSLPRVGGWEAGLDSFDLAGKRAVVSIDLGSAIVEPRVAALVLEAAEALIADAGLTRVDVAVAPPPGRPGVGHVQPRRAGRRAG